VQLGEPHRVQSAALGYVDKIKGVVESLRLADARRPFELVKNAELHLTDTILLAMKIGVGIDPRLGLARPQQHELVQQAARLGYDSLWTPGGATVRSIFQVCRDWFESTSQITDGGLSVGTSVIPFPAWSVPTLAAEAASLNDVCGGKFNLGIGLGAYPSPGMIKEFGLPTVPPLKYSREYLHSLRTLFKGEAVDYDGAGVHLHGVKLTFDTRRVPVYLAAMGQQMLRLAGECADGVTPNWCSAEQVAWMRPRVAEGARKAGRDPAEVPFALYIRVCIDDDEDAARRTFAGNMLGYAMARPGQPKQSGYRAHFARMGFDEVLTDLERRRDAGANVNDLVDLVPRDLLLKVGYFGSPAGAPDALRELSRGLDEAMVRLITVRPGDLDACCTAIEACRPSGWKPA
jgi:alkanesulfonate monooxygenase SsuD/methylene tetrahydromethanopterin reductase-like flavin-dependent oxidoreductase (luciferase family)